MHFRYALVFFVVIAGSNWVCAQKLPPPPKPTSLPPPPAPGMEPPGGTGFRNVTIPVFGDLELGMKRNSYDSIVALNTPSMQTQGAAYRITFKPQFAGNRLLGLKLLIPVSAIDSVPMEVLSVYTNKFGKPDSSDISTRTMMIPSVSDSNKTEEVKMTRSYALWIFNNYDQVITLEFRRKADGKYDGTVEINFAGNSGYYNLLQDLQKTEED